MKDQTLYSETFPGGQSWRLDTSSASVSTTLQTHMPRPSSRLAPAQWEPLPSPSIQPTGWDVCRRYNQERLPLPLAAGSPMHAAPVWGGHPASRAASSSICPQSPVVAWTALFQCTRHSTSTAIGLESCLKDTPPGKWFWCRVIKIASIWISAYIGVQTYLRVTPRTLDIKSNFKPQRCIYIIKTWNTKFRELQ